MNNPLNNLAFPVRPIVRKVLALILHDYSKSGHLFAIIHDFEYRLSIVLYQSLILYNLSQVDMWFYRFAIKSTPPLSFSPFSLHQFTFSISQSRMIFKIIPLLSEKNFYFILETYTPRIFYFRSNTLFCALASLTACTAIYKRFYV